MIRVIIAATYVGITFGAVGFITFCMAWVAGRGWSQGSRGGNGQWRT